MDTNKSEPELKPTCADSSPAQKDSGLVFEAIRENREGYFVEYLPARTNTGLAHLSLVFVEQPSKPAICRLMELECRSWIRRYPVPLYVGASEDTDSVIHPCDDEKLSYLLGLLRDGEIELHWRGNESPPIQTDPIDDERLLAIYNGVCFTTAEQRCTTTRSSIKSFQRGRRLFALFHLIRGVALPLFGLISTLFGILDFLRTSWKAVRDWLKMLGYTEKSEREKAKEEEEAKMRHHHYHCERNPDGFTRLMLENFERDAREQTIREKRDLEAKGNDTSRAS